jgi:hypothetical protein
MLFPEFSSFVSFYLTTYVVLYAVSIWAFAGGVPPAGGLRRRACGCGVQYDIS